MKIAGEGGCRNAEWPPSLPNIALGELLAEEGRPAEDIVFPSSARAHAHQLDRRLPVRMQVNWRAALTQDAGEAASPLERGESDGVGRGDVDALDHRL
jgi:hypothetical protein